MSAIEDNITMIYNSLKLIESTHGTFMLNEAIKQYKLSQKEEKTTK